MIEAKTSISLITKCWKVNLAFVMWLLACNLNAQSNSENIRTYVGTYSAEAVDQMVEYKIPASVILAQAIFESNSGKSDLAKRSNNHFGIKCHTEWGGDTIVKTDDTLNECFRRYHNVQNSYTDHSLFLRSRARYSHLFNLEVTDYKAWCLGLKASGYATYPTYAQELIKIIEENNLTTFDLTEQITITNVPVNIDRDLQQNNLSLAHTDLWDLVRSEALFIEEKDVMIRSLELIVDEEKISEIAENYKYCKPKVLDGAHNV